MHPTDASETGLTHRKYEDLKRYVQGVNCVAVGEIGLDHVRVRQDKGRDQQVEVFFPGLSTGERGRFGEVQRLVYTS